MPEGSGHSHINVMSGREFVVSLCAISISDRRRVGKINKTEDGMEILQLSHRVLDIRYPWQRLSSSLHQNWVWCVHGTIFGEQ